MMFNEQWVGCRYAKGQWTATLSSILCILLKDSTHAGWYIILGKIYKDVQSLKKSEKIKKPRYVHVYLRNQITKTHYDVATERMMNEGRLDKSKG